MHHSSLDNPVQETPPETMQDDYANGTQPVTQGNTIAASTADSVRLQLETEELERQARMLHEQLLRQRRDHLAADVRRLQADIAAQAYTRASATSAQVLTNPTAVPANETFQNVFGTAPSLANPQGTSPVDRVSDVPSGTRRHRIHEELSDHERPPLKHRKLQDIEKYKGETLAQHRSFIRSCKTQFLRSPRDFQNDDDKVLFAMQFLKGNPKESWYRYYEQFPDGAVPWSWGFFENFLRDLISDPLNREMDVQQEYTELRQRDSEDARTFDIKLASLEAQMEPVSELMRRDAFLTRCKPSIRRIIKNQVLVPATRHEVVALAARIEQNNDKPRDKPRKSKDSKERPSSSSDPPSGTRGKYQRRFTGKRRHYPNPKDTRKKGNAGDNEWQKDATCYKCNEKGHIAPNCKKDMKSSKKSSSVNEVRSGNDDTAPKSRKQTKKSEQPESSQS